MIHSYQDINHQSVPAVGHENPTDFALRHVLSQSGIPISCFTNYLQFYILHQEAQGRKLVRAAIS